MAHQLLTVVSTGCIAIASAVFLGATENPLPSIPPVQVSILAGVPLEAWAAEGLTAEQVASTLAVDEDRLAEINRVRTAIDDLDDKGHSLGETLRAARGNPGNVARREALDTLRQQAGSAQTEFVAAQNALLTSIAADSGGCQLARLQASRSCTELCLPVWIARANAAPDQLRLYAAAKRAQARSNRLGLDLSQQSQSVISSIEQSPGVQDTRSWVESQQSGLAALPITGDE